jgi:hypothetical protein
MKTVTCFVLAAFCCVVRAEGPTLAPEYSSIVTNKPSSETAASTISDPVAVDVVSSVFVSSDPVCKGPNCKLRYKNKENIAPCAVPKTVGVCVKETGCDACCRKVTTNSRVDVDICVPPCPSKESVRSYRGGRRVVYDYGKYEAVIKSDKDGNVEVNYRKRFLGL